MPKLQFTDAFKVLLLLHNPPGTVVLDNNALVPTHMIEAPVIEEAFTDAITDVLQPVNAVYVITAVPPDTPVINPVEELIEATARLLLVQNPPVTASLSVVVAPWQIDSVPVMDGGTALTVTIEVDTPQGNV